MEPVTIVTLLTAVIPFLTAALKRILPTSQLDEAKRSGLHALLPIVLGILSSGLYEYSRNKNWITALAVGLGSGGAASSARDIDKSLIGIASALSSLFKKTPV